MSRCRHAKRHHVRYILDGRLFQVYCERCEVNFPLGPARDTAETEVEVRATMLANEWKPVGGVRGIITEDESRGWCGWPYRQPENEAEHVGFLAAQIRNHDRDAIGVTWAGQHNADHEIEGQAGWLAREIYAHKEDDRG